MGVGVTLTPETLQILVNGGGVAVLIYLVWDMRAEQRRVLGWLMTIVQDSLVREAIARGLPTPTFPPSPSNAQPPTATKN